MAGTDRVNECALREVQQNDSDEQVRDTVSKGWSKDQWISGVMERALGVVARSAEKNQQEFRLTPWAPDGVRFSVQDDRNLSTFYAEQDEFTDKHLSTYFPTRNVDLAGDGRGEPIHIQGTQRPDSISLLRLSGARAGDTERKVCICFEGDGHNLDQGKKKGGMYMHEKMFQGAALCQDINPRVPAFFVTSALWKHDKERFQTFSAWSEAFLQAHVALVEQLLQYAHNRKTSSIHRRLQEMNPDAAVEYDFFCWVNAKRIDSRSSVEWDVSKSYDLMSGAVQRGKVDHGEDFQRVLEWRKMLVGRETAIDAKLSDASAQAADGLLRQTFSASVLSSTTSGIPVVVFAVPRVKMGDIEKLATDKSHACPGMWYPMHVNAYVAAVKAQGMANFLLPRALPASSFATPLSDLPHSDASRLIGKTELARFAKGIEGHVMFAMPWLWLNIGFLCALKGSMTYTVAKKSANTLQMYVTFTRKHATQIHSRDTVKNPMQMFKGTSSSLFAYVCRQRNMEVDLGADLEAFFEQKCGWTSPSKASSPAVFFKMIGASNLITAHTLARQIQCKTALGEKLEQAKAMFPLGAQVEIDYALECLCRHYYFVQDKTAERDGFVRKEDFESMQRQLRKLLREAQAGKPGLDHAPASAPAAESESAVQSETAPEAAPEPDPALSPDPAPPPDPAPQSNAVFPGRPQKARFGQKYRPPSGYRLLEDIAEEDVSLTRLRGQTVVVLWEMSDKTFMWYPATVVDRDASGTFAVQYPGDTARHDAPLSHANYGSYWMLVEKIPV